MTTTTATDVEITGLDAMQLRGLSGQSLVRVETDAGLVGYGEAGADGPTVRAQLAQLEEDLLGEDPLEVERHYDRMTTRQHPHRPHVPTVSGVDIALWDLAGKLLDRPVSTLLTGRFREAVPFYVNGAPEDFLDPESWERFADDLPATGTSVVKIGFNAAVQSYTPERAGHAGREEQTLKQSEIERVRRAAAHCRDALGWDADFVVHCHNEYDLPSAVGLAEAVAPAKPLWIEDPLPVDYADSWRALRSDSPTRVLTGEKLELPREFQPFVENEAVDVVQPDLAFAGGITGCRKIADLADRNNVPVTAHDVGSLVQNAATVHFGASVRNFWMTETKVGQLDLIDEMGESPVFEAADGELAVPDGPGLGVDLDGDVLRENRVEGEPYWG